MRKPTRLYSLFLLDLHRQAFHIGVFEVIAQVLRAEAEIGREGVRRERRSLEEGNGYR